MPLQSEQYNQLQDALVQAFDNDGLRRLVRLKLDNDLDEITKDADRTQRVFELIGWAERTGRTVALIEGAYRQNPTNPEIQKLIKDARHWQVCVDAGLNLNIADHVAPPQAEEPRTFVATPQMSAAPVQHHVFLSYSRADTALMRRLRTDLQAAGITSWIDDEDLEPGTPNWQRAIQHAIRSTKCMVVILSPDAVQSEWVMGEITSAKLNSRRVFPVVARGEPADVVPLSLLSTQHVDVGTDYASGVRRLIPSLQRHLGLVAPATAASARIEVVTNQPPPKPQPAPPIVFDWVTIPAGEFLMGSDKKKDQQAYDDETPHHRLYLPEFRIARVPITVAQFAKFVDSTAYTTTAELRGSSQVWTGSIWKNVKGADWAHPRGRDSNVTQKADHPVTCVSWHDAIAFCVWAGVRLPTEAEWEKATRGTDGRIWPWGNQKPNKELCNFNMDIGDTTAVGSYPKVASPYGVLDAAGNVWEWTSSLWGDDEDRPTYGYPYKPDDGRENKSAPDRLLRVLRGGSFNSYDKDVRCAVRHGGSPGVRGDLRGFRVLSPGD